MAFRISKFLPGTNKKRIDLPPKPAPVISWVRRAVPQTGGQNYSLGNQFLPLNSLSGPLNTNAKRFNALEPAMAISHRQYADVTIGGAGILNGQIFSQPLVDPTTGGFGQSLMPLNALPYNIFGIVPAGQA